MNCEQIARLRRRTFLQAGGISALGLTLPDLLAAHSATQPNTSFGRAKACIYMYLTGGPAQQETFDMKPEAPQAARGEFRPIASTVPGIDVCEHLPRMAQAAGLYAILRSVYHDNTFHGAGAHWNLTGLPHAPREPTPEFYIDRRDSPCIGAVLTQRYGEGRPLPTAVHLPRGIRHGMETPFAGQDAGFLGPAYDPLRMFYEGPESLPGTLPPDFRLPADVSLRRMADRARLLQEVDSRPVDQRACGPLADHQARALDILQSVAGAWQAFTLEGESPQTIERYGNHKFGRSCLVARRLVEAGVKLVMVSWPAEDGVHFDTHAGHFPSMRDNLLPPVDQGAAALLTDLNERGLLDETLVVWAGEFGRTPSLNGNQPAGRDHWPYVYSVLLAGGGIHGGRVYGSSDAIAAHPADKPVHVRDFVATIYHALGVGPDATVTDPTGRPHYVVTGQPVVELF